MALSGTASERRTVQRLRYDDAPVRATIVCTVSEILDHVLGGLQCRCRRLIVAQIRPVAEVLPPCAQRFPHGVWPHVTARRTIEISRLDAVRVNICHHIIRTHAIEIHRQRSTQRITTRRIHRCVHVDAAASPTLTCLVEIITCLLFLIIRHRGHGGSIRQSIKHLLHSRRLRGTYTQHIQCFLRHHHCHGKHQSPYDTPHAAQSCCIPVPMRTSHQTVLSFEPASFHTDRLSASTHIAIWADAQPANHRRQSTNRHGRKTANPLSPSIGHRRR